MRKLLLLQWGEAMAGLQIHGTGNTRLDGGILCPACMRIHGRSGDAVLPFVSLYAETKEKQFLNAARDVFTWSENMVRPDGSYNNDTNSNWNGITVFAVIALGETLLHYAAILPEEFRSAVFHRFRTGAEYLLQNIENIGGNVNYPITCCYAMALAAKLIPEEEKEYGQKGYILSRKALEYITEDGLLYGEGHPMNARTPRNCRPVDIGYNVEESIPALIQYAELMQDAELMEQAAALAEDHLAFLLPDGGWDNSFGSRSYKWSYWGSRTSDGCMAGFAILGKKDRIFREALRRNLQQLRKCTKDGLLYGGPMYHNAGEPPCIHHTICHAKALALMQEESCMTEEFGSLPAEKERLHYYPSIATAILRQEKWRATFTNYDYQYLPGGHPTGGTLSLLWNRDWGIVMFGGMDSYRQNEPNNMQMPRYQFNICPTPRIEIHKGGKTYRSSNDLSAWMETGEKANEVWVKSSGQLRTSEQQTAGGYYMDWRLDNEAVILRTLTEDKQSVLVIPIVCSDTDQIEQPEPQTILIHKDTATLRIQTEKPLEIPEEYREENGRIRRLFHPVGGFQALLIQTDASDGQIRIEIKKNNS